VSQSPHQPPPFPTPYEPPRFVDYRGAPQLPDLLAPGRRAATVMFILGGLALACGTLFGASMSKMTDTHFLTSAGVKLPDTTGTGYTPIQVLRASVLVGAVGMVLVGVIYIVLGLLVRRGSRVSAILGIALTCLAVGWVLLNGIFAFFAGGNVASGVCTIGFVGVLVPVLATLIRWLAQSLPAAKQLAAYQQQWALQQMYFYHQQQAHQQLAPGPPGSIPDYTIPPPNAPPTDPPANPR
jgi:hypothetical protein